MSYDPARLRVFNASQALQGSFSGFLRDWSENWYLAIRSFNFDSQTEIFSFLDLIFFAFGVNSVIEFK